MLNHTFDFIAYAKVNVYATIKGRNRNLFFGFDVKFAKSLRHLHKIVVISFSRT